MPRPMSSLERVAAAGCVATVVAAFYACVTVPPPDVATTSAHPPVIDHSAVVPPEATTLTAWPATVAIPIELFDPDEPFEYEVFVDYEPTVTSGPDLGPIAVQAPPDALDGGVLLLEVVTPGNPLDGLCHKLEVDVAHSFSSVHTPDSVGGDSVWWWYGPHGCPSTWQQDGAFPVDAPYDGVVLVPESGGFNP